MDAALAHAFAGLGHTAPNPSVGCIIVKNGKVIGQARTADTGRPHAEPQALEQAGDQAQGARVYVTLEPCSHYGKTPPCAEALVAAKPAEVIIACRDPFEKVSGRGIKMLEDAGITVLVGVRQAQAEAMNEGFFTLIRTGRPFASDDRRASLFDADFILKAGESRDEGLERLGKAGLTRVRIVK